MIAELPLLAHAGRGHVLAYRAGRPVSVARFLADVRRNATRLHPGGYVMNLCSDRYRFAVGLAAALYRGVVTLLPPNLAPQPLARLAAAYAVAQALADPDAAFAGLRALAVELGEEEDQTQPVPAFDPAQLAVVAFTSGSTGEAQPQPKTWGSLVQGAAAEAAGLQLAGMDAGTLVGTVPAQHMYGLESTVLLPLRNGLALHAARPLYPADVRAALAEVPGARVLVTTPVHLRALLSADLDLPTLSLIVCATAPLAPALALQAEARYRAPLREIYGFTEAGMVAVRRTAHDPAWRTLPGVSVRMQDGAARFRGGHVQREAAAGDIVEVRDETTFVLHGRGADLINVAGKRSSLAQLNQALTSIEGVEDGAFFMPVERDDGSVTRPLAFAVAPGLTREAVLAALRERIDPVFLPRPLHLVAALPRNATGKLTREALAALSERCALEAPAPAKAVLAPDHPVAQGHFPGNPVIPGALILDAVLRSAEQRMRVPPLAWEVRAAKFVSALRPGEPMRIDFAVDAGGDLRFDCVAGGRAVASGLLRRPAAAGRA